MYSLFLSEEINLSFDYAKDAATPQLHTALLAYLDHIWGRGRNFYNFDRGRSSSSSLTQPPQLSINPSIGCQICGKHGHSAYLYWHHLNPQYPTSSSQPTTLVTVAPQTNSNGILDSSASSHLTNNIDNIFQPSNYQGTNTITIEDGRPLPIAHSGSGLLPHPHT